MNDFKIYRNENKNPLNEYERIGLIVKVNSEYYMILPLRYFYCGNLSNDLLSIEDNTIKFRDQEYEEIKVPGEMLKGADYKIRKGNGKISMNLFTDFVKEIYFELYPEDLI